MSAATTADPLLAANGIGWSRLGMAERAARDLEPGSYVNLGLGIPQIVADYIDETQEIFLHSENGILGLGAAPHDDDIEIDLIDAGKRYVTIREGASIFDSTLSFSIVRSGRLDVAILGAMEVAPNGDLANWTAPGRTPGVGGAMDLVVGSRAVWVLVLHQGKNGDSKLLPACTLPLTGAGVVDRVLTDLGVFEPAGDAFRVLELAPGVDRERVSAATAAALDWSGLA